MEFTTDIFSQFDKKWALLTAGDKENFNTMTVSWGRPWYYLGKACGNCLCAYFTLYS